MLIEFTVKNFRSIKEAQTLSLVKSKNDDSLKGNSFQAGPNSKLELLRTAAIYGPNAAGKSNIIRAMMAMESIVVNSASQAQEGDKVPVTPFLFDDISSEEPTEFEIVFMNDGVRYQYGFAATQKRIEEEWLIAFPKAHPQRWFSRIHDSKKDEPVFKLGDFLTGQKAVWKTSTRDNALFLSTAVQLNSDQLKPVYKWFKTKLRPAYVGGWGPGFTASQCEDKKSREQIVSFLKAADLGIHDVSVETKPFDVDLIPDELPSSARQKIIEEMADKKVVDIKTVHQTPSNKLVSMDFDEESEGTQKFFSFAGPWLDTLDNGYILVIDELHDNLHPKLVQYLVELFHDDEMNTKNAQLIFTTHETSILNQDVFRRDQVWFCEKDEAQATQLFPLTDFSPRKGVENLELSYLAGRYGALPYVRRSAMNKVG